MPCNTDSIMLHIFILAVSQGFCQTSNERLHFLKKIGGPMSHFLEHLTDLVDFFVCSFNKTLQPAHLLCILNNVLN